jgi:hypothetical protein
MVNTVRIPLTLEPHVHAINIPVRISQVHHSTENSLIFAQQGFMTNTFHLRVTKLPETDISVDSERHEENQGGIEENEP